MRIKITSGANTWLIAGESQAQADGNYQGRLLNELKLTQSLTALGSAPVTLNISVRNDDGYISPAIDLWGAAVEITTDASETWSGTITAYDSDGDGITYLVATEKAAPELAIQMPDEVARLVTVNENFHTSAVNVTLPLVFGGNSTKPHLLKGILIDKTQGIYLLCVGEIHQVAKVYRGTEEITTGFTAYTGTADQTDYAGFAYVQLTDEAITKNDDGSYAEISADIIGLKLGSATIEQCRNGARVLYCLLTTAKEGVNGWGLGIGTSEINETAFNQAISDLDTAGLKLDGIFYFRQVAQSWIDQICLAIRGAYSIGRDGTRALYINKSAASAKTYTETNMRMLRHGVGAYTGRVYNKGKLDFDYNPITGQFMQSAQYEDSTSIAAIGDQEFYGQSYLIKDMATAQAVVEYTCKRSLIGARKVYFETDELPSGARNGTVITVTRPDLGISGDYQITSLEISDHVHTIEAEKYDTSIFSYGTPGTAIDWPKDAPIIPTINPGAASGLTLSTDVEYDSAGDGTAIPYISGTFSVPAGKYLGAAVFWGEGASPSAWENVTIKGTEFKIKPVKAGQQYTVKVQMFNQSGTSAAITGTIIAGSHEALPPTPDIITTTGFGCIVINITISAFAAFSHFEIQRQKADGSGLTTVASEYRGTAFTDDSAAILSDYDNSFRYRARAISRSSRASAWTDFTAAVSATQVKNKDVSADQFIGKHFTTALDVGESQDGVRFTAAGIEMWQSGTRKVLIPVTGNPDFEGVITALAGFIGECVIANGGLQSADFVSGNRGWNIDKAGDAEFNNIRARGAVKTVVFEKDEISVVGGRTLIRPAGVVSAYNYTTYIQTRAQAHFDSAWTILCELLGVTETAPDITIASYAEYLALDQAYYRDIATAMGFATYEAGIDPAVYDDTAMQAYLLACWTAINSTLGTTHEAPAFPAMTQAAFAAMEAGYWNLAAEIIDNPPAFAAVIGANDCRVTLDDAEQFSVGDVVRMKDGLSGDYWGVIFGISGDDIDIVFASGELFAITAGQTIVNYGPVNSGGVLLDGQAPLIDVYTHNGEPWSGADIRVRIGNLKGWGNINHDTYGIAVGQPDGQFMIYDTRSGRLQLKGDITIESGVGYSSLTDKPTSLAGINSTEGSKLTGIADGATVGAAWGTNLTGIPSTLGAPAGKGLFLNATHLGFYDTSTWKTYMDNAGNFALVGAGTHGLVWNAEAGTLTISGSISILGGSGYGNLTDKPTNLASINSTEGNKLTGIADGADVTSANTSYDTARVAGATASTVKDNAANALANAAAAQGAANTALANAATAQGTANTAVANAATANGILADIAADNKLTSVEKQAARKEWDIIAAEKAGINAQSTTFGITTENTTYDNAFQALATYLNAGSTWSTGIPTWLADANLANTTDIVGSTFRSTWKTYYDARTALLNAISVKAKSLADTAQGAANTAAANAATAQGTANTAVSNAATAQGTANTALANADTAQGTANTAVSNAATANGLLADIAADNKLVPSEKHAARKEWDIVAAERSVNSSHAMNIAGFTVGIAEGSFNEAASDAYWSQCWTKLNALLGESNAEPAFPAQTYASFAAEEAGYYNLVRLVIDSDPVTVPPTPDVLALNTVYITAFQSLANYLNAGSTWSTGIPTWLADANINTTTDIVGATFRATWKAYYDARTALLNAIATKAKALADSAQVTADVGAAHAVTIHAPSNADHTQTTINGGLVTTGTVQVVQGGTVAAGITGNTSGDTAVRFWAGSSFESRASAPFRVTQDGKMVALAGQIGGFSISGGALTNISSLGDSALIIMSRTIGNVLYQTQLLPRSLKMMSYDFDTSVLRGFTLDENCRIVIDAGVSNNVFYRKWNDGVIEQWGTLTAYHVAQDMNVSFGIPFVSTVQKIIMTQPQRGSAASGAIWRPRVNTVDAFTVRMDSFNSDGGAVSHSADWYAFGY